MPPRMIIKSRRTASDQDDRPALRVIDTESLQLSARDKRAADRQAAKRIADKDTPVPGTPPKKRRKKPKEEVKENIDPDDPLGRRYKPKKTRLSSEADLQENTNQIGDSCPRLRESERKGEAAKEDDEDMPTAYRFPRHSKLPPLSQDEQKLVNTLLRSLGDYKTSSPTLYYNICVGVLKHFRKGEPV